MKKIFGYLHNTWISGKYHQFKCYCNPSKGRTNKYNAGSFKVEAFYKGLEELENELDPKQIEKLIIFLEVIRTQEKFSKV